MYAAVAAAAAELRKHEARGTIGTRSQSACRRRAFSPTVDSFSGVIAETDRESRNDVGNGSAFTPPGNSWTECRVRRRATISRL